MSKILLIEDDKFLRELIIQKLGREGFEATEAPEGEAGLTKMKEERPDLVLLDLILPGIDGFEVLAELKKDEALRQIPVIIISNSGQPAEIEKAKELGVRDWLVKTEFDPQEVLEKVKRQIGPAQ